MKRQRVGLGMIVAVLALMAGACDKGEDSLADVPTMEVQPAPFQVAVEEMGVIEATRVVPVLAPFRSKILRLSPTGQMVEQGEAVGQLSSEQEVENLQDRLNDLKTIATDLGGTFESLKISLRSSTLDLDSQEAQLAFERAMFLDAAQEWARTDVLREQGISPDEDLRNAESRVIRRRLDTMNQDLSFQSEILGKDVEQKGNLLSIERQTLKAARARAEIDKAQREVDEATLIAPATGVFMRKRRWDWRRRMNVEPNPGEEVRRGQMLGEIPDMSTLIVKTQVSERDWLKVREGMEARLRFDALKGKEIAGTVRQVGRVAIPREQSAGGSLEETDSDSGQKVFDLIVEFDGTNVDGLRPGLTAQVRIVTSETPGQIAVPLSAVEMTDDGPVVSVKTLLGRLEQRPVELGPKNATSVVVTSGLTPGDRVVTDRQALK